jgi:hypothetical protein
MIQGFLAESVEAFIAEEPASLGKEEKKITIIIHLLGLAPAGYLAAPDNGA